LPYTDIRDGLLHDGAPGVIHQNDDIAARTVAIGRPISARMDQGLPDDALIPAQQFHVPPLHALYADGTVRRITGYLPPRYTPRITTTPEENPMPVHTPNTPVTTLDEAATALAQFQESMAREAQANGHPREFGEWIDRAIAEIPGLRAVDGPDFRPQGNMHLALRITIPNANPANSRDTIHDTFQREVRAWAQENGHGTLPITQVMVAYVLAHPEIIIMTDGNTSGYLDNYSVTTRRTTGASTRRVEFVRD
jgi:hypothetical protein